jgi:hypothetical protein
MPRESTGWNGVAHVEAVDVAIVAHCLLADHDTDLDAQRLSALQAYTPEDGIVDNVLGGGIEHHAGSALDVVAAVVAEEQHIALDERRFHLAMLTARETAHLEDVAEICAGPESERKFYRSRLETGEQQCLRELVTAQLQQPAYVDHALVDLDVLWQRQQWVRQVDLAGAFLI